MQAAVRTILGGCANDARLAFQRPMVRRTADDAARAKSAALPALQRNLHRSVSIDLLHRKITCPERMRCRVRPSLSSKRPVLSRPWHFPDNKLGSGALVTLMRRPISA